jgi:hypothetical protein
MEFPDDVLQLIRDYSRPRMRFYKEYRQGLTELGFERAEHWHVLRDRLCSSEAEQVLSAFLSYKEATMALKRFHWSDWPGPYSVYYDELHRLISVQTESESRLDQTFGDSNLCVRYVSLMAR